MVELILWYVILFVLFALYFIFEAYEWGAGMVYGLFASNEEEKRKVLSAVKSVWAANEVWLLAFIGLSYAVFPQFFRSMSDFYTGLFFVFVFAYILQIISYNLVRVFFDRGVRPLFEWLYVLSSFTLAVLSGLFIALIIRGGTSEKMHMLSGNFSPFSGNPGYLDYFTVLFVLLFVLIILLNGLGWVVHRSSGAFGRKLKFKIQKLAFGGIGLVLLDMILLYLLHGGREFVTNAHRIAWFVFVFLMIGTLGGLVMIRTYQKDNKGFFLATNLFIYFWTAVLLIQYPYLIHAHGANGGISVFHTDFQPLETYHLRWWTIGIALILFVYSILVHKYSKGHALLTAQKKK